MAGAIAKTAGKTIVKSGAKKAVASGAKKTLQQNLKQQAVDWAKNEALSRAQALPGQLKEGAKALPGRIKSGAAAGAGAIGGGIAGGFSRGKDFFHPGNANKSFMIIIFVFAILAVLIFVFWFIRAGGLQNTAGNQFVAEQQTQDIVESTWLKRLTNWFENPFGVQATTGEYEEQESGTQASTSAPNQAFSVDIKATPVLVSYDTSSLTFIATVKNAGNTELKQLDLKLFSEHPIYNSPLDNRLVRCFRFTNENTDQGCYYSDGYGEELTCKLFDIQPFSSKQIVLIGGTVDYDCVYESMGLDFRPDIPVDVFVSAQGTTYYPTSSRLSVERIRTDYGVLLIQNNLLRQESRGAIYQTGTAMQIDLDIGEQPILDTVNKGGLLFSWVEVGTGKLDEKKSPFLFIITPGSFGKCIPEGIGSATSSLVNCNDQEILKKGQQCILCDEDLTATWCDTESPVYGQIAQHASTIKESFDWACGLIGQKDESGNIKYHVCATNTLGTEFSTMSCGMTLTQAIDANRNTKYVTALALYPYTVEAPLTSVQAYCVGGECPA